MLEVSFFAHWLFFFPTLLFPWRIHGIPKGILPGDYVAHGGFGDYSEPCRRFCKGLPFLCDPFPAFNRSGSFCESQLLAAGWAYEANPAFSVARSSDPDEFSDRSEDSMEMFPSFPSRPLLCFSRRSLRVSVEPHAYSCDRNRRSYDVVQTRQRV